VIKKNVLENVDEISEEELDPLKSMRDYGANSLDIIEIVSGSMRELNIKIPRAELTDIQNMDQLADKFLEYIKE
jgi:acyl carrier protein